MSTVITPASAGLMASREIEQAARRERPRLLEFIRRRVRTDQDAEDILQDVFFALVSSYSVTEPIERLTAWLFRAARNRIIDLYRKRKPAAPTLDELEESLPVHLEQVLFEPSVDPDALYDRSLVWTELAEALDELPEEQREVFVMHELDGKSFKEIAEMTGEPLNTLLSRKHYAVLALRDRLQTLYDDLLS